MKAGTVQLDLFPEHPTPSFPATDAEAQGETVTSLRAQLAAAHRARSELLRTLAHELRTPLTTVLGWAGLLRRGETTDEDRRRAADAVERNARALSARLETLLEHERVRTGQAAPPAAPLELRVVVDDVLRTAAFTAQAKRILVTGPAVGATAHVLGHADSLRQALWSLVHNALKHTSVGGRVTVELHAEEGWAELRVADTGPGLDEDGRTAVLRAAQESAHRRPRDSGFGLSVTRELVELHGGTLHLRSPGVGRGCTFILRFPLLLDATPPRPSAATSWLEAPLEGVTVLLVDDDPTARDVLAAILEECGARVISAGSTGEALEALAHADPDVLISDISMPGEDGYALIRKVRALSLPPARRIPAAAVTALGELEDRVRALSEGYQIHLAKPVEPQKLARVIAQLAGRNAQA
ncbi:MAG: ATP-binding protein [Myxococcota bacterium]